MDGPTEPFVFIPANPPQALPSCRSSTCDVWCWKWRGASTLEVRRPPFVELFRALPSSFELFRAALTIISRNSFKHLAHRAKDLYSGKMRKLGSLRMVRVSAFALVPLTSWLAAGTAWALEPDERTDAPSLPSDDGASSD